MEALITHTSPVQISGGGGRLGRQAPPHLVNPATPQFDELYRDSRPSCPMHRGDLRHISDPVERHGQQMLQLRTVKKKGALQGYVFGNVNISTLLLVLFVGMRWAYKSWSRCLLRNTRPLSEFQRDAYHQAKDYRKLHLR